ncbi:hypothetical protein [Butyrivibrio sp. XPD2002]|uniref:hypothetical protein n=1 Tax=Butyrivibrio sp. XPD2002 TaxID=1280665 RepID=UPI0003FADF24|nr:hypothetical protein [Butyrivibrio sp. XPD2002]
MSGISKHEARINEYLEMVHLEKRFVSKITKQLLEKYCEILHSDNPPITVPLTSEQVVKQKQEMRREYLLIMQDEGEEAKKKQSLFVTRVLNTSWIVEKIDMVLGMVADFHDVGSLYREILEESYLNDKIMSVEKMAVKHSMSESGVRNTRREAIKLFAFYIWAYAQRRESEDIIAGKVSPADAVIEKLDKAS